MELKQAYVGYARMEAGAFNQTKMELKHKRGLLRETLLFSFNQTKMELKPTSNHHLHLTPSLLIRPKWN